MNQAIEPPQTLSSKKRILSIDILRGIVMMVMAIDHVRDFIHIHGMDQDPTSLASTSPAVFFTRFITHYCAPIFVFLSGTSIYLQAQRKSKKELSVFLLKRGLWFMFAEIVIVNLLMSFNPLYNFVMLQVIWVIGLSMVLMSTIIYLPFRAILVISIALIFGHNLLDQFNYSDPTNTPIWFALIHQQAYIEYAPMRILFINYPIIPWFGVMMLGYCMGKWYSKDYDTTKRQQQLIWVGISTIGFFLLLRYTNLYGDPSKWTTQPRGTVYSIISFFNVTKYPPSLLYCCITLGPALIALSLLEKTSAAWTRKVSVFGRVAFYYYLWHFFLVHLTCVILFFVSGKGVNDIIDYNSPFLFRNMQWGYPLWIVYLVWVILMIILYPICKKYDHYKSTHKHWWLSYL